jgi:hypothetical protein
VLPLAALGTVVALACAVRPPRTPQHIDSCAFLASALTLHAPVATQAAYMYVPGMNQALVDALAKSVRAPAPAWRATAASPCRFPVTR